MRLTRRRLSLAAAILLAAAAGMASASVLRAGADEPPPDPAEPLGAEGRTIGDAVPDPDGGPPWAVRVSVTPSGRRCAMTGRVDGEAFGPLDGAGEVVDTGPSFSGSCAAAGAEPVQLAVARYPSAPGGAARSVLFGVAEEDAGSIAVTHDGTSETIEPDDEGTFLVVREGISAAGGWEITVTLTDTTTRSYVL